jgi:hypothetical protein
VDVRRLRVGEWLAGIGGAVLLVSLFLGWYGVEFSDGSATAWESFAVVDLFLACAAVLGVGLAVMTAVQRSAAVPIALASLAGLLGIIATALLLWRTAMPPDIAAPGTYRGPIGGDDPDTTRETGLWLGLGSCAAMLAGAILAMRDESFPRAARANVPIETLPPPAGGAA